MMTRPQAIHLLFALLIAVPGARAQEALPTARIGVVMDGPAALHTRLQQLIREETIELTGRAFDVQWFDRHQLTADWTAAGVRRALDQLLADDSVDVVLALGTLASHEAATWGTLPKPVLAPSIINPTLQGLPAANGRSGVPNLNYLTIPTTLARDLDAFQEMVGFEQVAVLVNAAFADVIPDFDARLEAVGAEQGITVEPVRVGASEEEALATLASAEAVYVFPLFELAPDAHRRLVDGLIARRLPSFSFLGEPEVERGLMASLNPDVFPRLARRVALNLHRVLLGDAPESLPVAFAAGERLVLNMRTARAIGFAPSVGTLLEATLLHAEPAATGRALALESAVHEGVAANLSLAAGQREVLAGSQDVRIARSTLRPQLEIGGTGLMIDADRAEASFGSQAQYTLTSAVTLTQVIYSESARANVTIQRHLQAAREFDYGAERLDVALRTTEAYLNVLRAKTFERIQHDNLQRTRTNLELARVRRDLGQARAGEVLRWESEMAQNRKGRIDAFAQRNAAEVALNQVLNRPLEEPFATVEAALDDATALPIGRVFQTYLTNIPAANRLRDFMVAEGLRNAPELQTLDAAIAARERLLDARRRAFWSPTIALQGQLSSNLAEGGEGVSGPGVPDGLPANLFPHTNEVSWNIGVNVALPLSTGRRRDAERIQAQEDLAALHLERDVARQRIEQNIRTTMHFASASFAGIREAEAASNAAQQTLELVADAYAQGAADAVDVLEAQHTALVSSEAAATAVYDFLIDLMRLERASGQFGFFRTDAEQAAFLHRVEAFMAQQ